MNAPFTPTPAFTLTADTDCDVSHGGEDFRAYFTEGRCIGLIRYGDDLPMDRTYAIYWVGFGAIRRWEKMIREAAEDAEAYDPDAPDQRGYDAAREAHDVA